MKRPLSHIIVPVACLLMLPFCMPHIALGGETRNHTGGRFQLEISGNNQGWVQSIEGGAASSDTVQEKLGPVPKQNTVAPRPSANLRPVQQNAPCANPPCGLGRQQPPAVSTEDLKAKQDDLEDRKDSMSDLDAEMQLKIQQQQDRRAKADSALSNTLKKQSDTSNGIIGNMK